MPELAGAHGEGGPKREGDRDPEDLHARVRHKLRAYRVAGGAACPEAIIFHLLLYALFYLLKHET